MSLTRSTAAVLLASAAVFTLGACHPARLGHGENHQDRAMSVDARLDCPQSQGSLTRVDMAADGRSCRYTDSEGREAKLMFLDPAGRSAKDALSGTEADLKAMVPAAVPAPDAPESVAGNTVSEGDADHDDDGDHGGKHDHTSIDLPGIHITADGGKGGDAHIRAFGQTIDAHGKNAVVHAGWNGKQAQIIAHDHGVEIRAGWFGQRSVDANYMLAAETAGPTGVHAAGYYAKGPAAGPLVVGVETSKSDNDEDRHGDRFKDLRKLVDRNVHNL